MLLINDLTTHLAHHRDAVDAAIKRVLDRAWFILGPEVEAFERAFADYVGVNHCTAVANGTEALELALRAVDIGVGDKVATVANASMYTCTALQGLGATPVFMDVDLTSQLASEESVALALEQGVKAMVVTHLYGRAHVAIDEISRACRDAGVALVEDCAQAHGARVAGRHVGSFGDVGSFSFYPTKNLGALGDGGAVVSRHPMVADKVRALRQYGWSSKYKVELAGARNSRMDEMQAAILSSLLPHLDGWNARRCAVAAAYSAHITNPEVSLPLLSEEAYVAHLYVIRSTRRDALRDHLRANGIGAEIHYPIPDHRQPVFGSRFTDLSLPNTEQLAREILTLPCYPEMRLDAVERVSAAVNALQ